MQAAIGEGRTAFALNKRSLVALADAQVAERVIDLMVGLTYPSHFVIKRGGGGAVGMMRIGAGVRSVLLADRRPGRLYGCYSPYAWAASDYWRDCGVMSPYLLGYGPGYYNGYYGYDYPWVAIPGGGTGGGGGGEVVVQPEGRVVNGRGYTQVTPVDPRSAASTAAAGRADEQRRRVELRWVERRLVGRLLGRRRGRRRRPHGDAAAARPVTVD